MRALVTGANGFVGHWLVRQLAAIGDEVIPAGGPESRSSIRLDVTDGIEVNRLVADVRPEAVYHLAGIAHGPTAAAEPAEAIRVTVGGTANVVSAAAGLEKPPTVLIASSADVYRPPEDATPVTEAHRIEPHTLYGATKAAQEMVATAIARDGAVPLLIARSFNQVGPGQREDFVAAAFALQLARIAAGAEPVLAVGNLEPQRDFVDVRDAVIAFHALVEAGQTGPFNIATGRAIAVGQLLSDLIAISGVRAEVVIDPSRLRPIDTPFLAGDATRLTETVGWAPTRTLRDTLTDIWADAVERAEHSRAPA